MSQNRTSTTLDIKVNAREVNALRRELQQTFSAGPVREFNMTVQRLERTMSSLAKLMRQNVDSAKSMRTGTKEYRDLGKEIENAEKKLEKLQRRLGGGAGGSGGGRGMGGGMAGGMAGGIAGAQLPMMGAGAITTAMAGIPVFGMMAAGSMMAAMSTYGSFKSAEQARQGAVPYLLGAGTQYQRQQLSAGTEGSWGASSQDTTTLVQHTQMRQAARSLGESVTDPAALGGVAGVALGRTSVGNRLMEKAGLRESGTLFNQRLRDQQELTFAKQGVEWKAGQGASYSRPFDPAAYERAGMAMGYTPQQAMQKAGGLAARAGAPVDAKQFELALAMERRFGVSTETTGGLMRGMRRAGMGDDPETIALLIGQQVAKDLEGSELNEALQAQSAFLEQQTKMGRQVNLGGTLRAEMGLYQAGISGYRTGAIVDQFTSTAAQRGVAGPGQATDYRLMRAMGYSGTGGADEMSKYALAMQNPGQVAEALPGYIESFRSQGLGENTQAYMLQRALGQMGANISPSEARAIARNGGKAGTLAGGRTVEEIIAEAQGVTSGTMKFEAGLEGTRVATGGKMAGVAQNLQMAQIRLAESAANFAPVLEDITGGMADLAVIVRDLTANMGSWGGPTSMQP